MLSSASSDCATALLPRPTPPDRHAPHLTFPCLPTPLFAAAEFLSRHPSIDKTCTVRCHLTEFTPDGPVLVVQVGGCVCV